MCVNHDRISKQYTNRFIVVVAASRSKQNKKILRVETKQRNCLKPFQRTQTQSWYHNRIAKKEAKKCLFLDFNKKIK